MSRLYNDIDQILIVTYNQRFFCVREKLAAVFSLVQEVNVLDSKDESNLALLARPELGITFTKLHCWRLTQYEKCVFVDADTLVSSTKFCSIYNIVDTYSSSHFIFFCLKLK